MLYDEDACTKRLWRGAGQLVGRCVVVEHFYLCQPVFHLISYSLSSSVSHSLLYHALCRVTTSASSLPRLPLPSSPPASISFSSG